MAVLIVTHHVDEVRTHATQLYRIEDMRIKQLNQNNLPEQDTLLQERGAVEQERLVEQILSAEQIKHGGRAERQKQVVRHV